MLQYFAVCRHQEIVACVLPRELSLIYVAVCCSVLLRVAVRCSVLQCTAVCCSVLQCVVTKKSLHVRFHVSWIPTPLLLLDRPAVRGSELQCVAVFGSVFQWVAVCCSLL